MASPVRTIDVAHPPRHPDKVEAALLEAWSAVRNSPDLRLLKVIHGRSGSTREIVRNWAYRHRSRFRGVIPGEDYSLSNPLVQELRREAGLFGDADLDAGNEGIVVVWMR